jgi:hypothetical protein
MVPAFHMGRTNIEIDEKLVRKAREADRAENEARNRREGAGTAGALGKPERHPSPLRVGDLEGRREGDAEEPRPRAKCTGLKSGHHKSNEKDGDVKSPLQIATLMRSDGTLFVLAAYLPVH